jgi:hypothetical protein
VRQECENEREKEKPATSRDGAGSRAEAENVVPEPEPTADDIREIFDAMRERAAAKLHTHRVELAELRAARTKATGTPSKRPNLSKLNFSAWRESSDRKGTTPQARP